MGRRARRSLLDNPHSGLIPNRPDSWTFAGSAVRARQGSRIEAIRYHPRAGGRTRVAPNEAATGFSGQVRERPLLSSPLLRKKKEGKGEEHPGRRLWPSPPHPRPLSRKGTGGMFRPRRGRPYEHGGLGERSACGHGRVSAGPEDRSCGRETNPMSKSRDCAACAAHPARRPRWATRTACETRPTGRPVWRWQIEPNDKPCGRADEPSEADTHTERAVTKRTQC
jgi:hypothetical protein